MVLIPLNMLLAGESAEVAQVLGIPEHVHRLHELGLSAGTRIEMVQPGSPCIIRLSGSRLCFRESDAIGVLVRPGQAEEAAELSREASLPREAAMDRMVQLGPVS